MTAYGRAVAGVYLVELHSVNRKGLELNVQVPRELLSCDAMIRGWVKSKIERGSVLVRVSRDKTTGTLAGLPRIEELKPIKDHFESLSHALDIQGLDLPFLCDQLSALGSVSAEPDQKALETGILEALENLLQMKEQEAKNLVVDIQARLNAVKEGVASIATQAVSAPDILRQRLEEKLRTLQLDPQDLGKELVLFADRCDVTEELVRLNSHLEQFEQVLGSDERCVGRKLDFLLIEIAREFNTIAAKSFQKEITDVVVCMKSEIEKIREQVQNIE